MFDLEDSLVFPPKIVLTALRPDGVLYSEKLKTVLLLELTVPIEDCVLTAQSLKSKRYEGLIRECQSNGWKGSLLTIEIGCRGYVSDSFKYILKQLGLSKLDSNLTIKQCSAIAL